MNNRFKYTLVSLFCITLLTGCYIPATEEVLPTSTYTTATINPPTTTVVTETSPATLPPSAPGTKPTTVFIEETTTPPTTTPPTTPPPTTTPPTTTPPLVDPAPTVAPTESNPQPTATSLFPEMEETVLQLMNEHRVQAGREPLVMAYDYYDCAEIRTRECISYFSHSRPDGRRWSTVYSDLSLCDDLLLVGENLARHFKTAEDMVQALMDSPSHRSNILDERFQYVAICILPVDGYDNLYAMSQQFIQKKE